MKTIFKTLLIALTISGILSGCSSKTIQKESPCACYDLVVKVS